MDTMLERLDTEHEGRIQELFHSWQKSGRISNVDVFAYSSVADTIEKNKVILPGYDTRHILTTYPFSSTVYVTICPTCVSVKEQEPLKAFLDHGAITPVLVRPYQEYTESFVKLILKYPHMSVQELSFWRFIALTSNVDEMVCAHCIAEKRKQYRSLIKRKNFTPEAIQGLDNFLDYLYPYIKPDYELIDEFGRALKKNDTDKMTQIYSVSQAVSQARTTQAFQARSIIPSSSIPLLIHESEKMLPRLMSDDIAVVEEALANDIHMDIPNNVDIAKFLDCVAPHREEMSSIVDSLLAEASANKSGYLTSLSSKSAELGEEIRRLSKHKGFLVYRASSAFLNSNKTLLAAGLLATVLGITGNYLGCGITLLSGIGTHAVKRSGKLRIPEEAKALIDEVKHTVKPYVHKLLAKYLNIDIRAVQLWDINSELKKLAEEKTKPAKRLKRTMR